MATGDQSAGALPASAGRAPALRAASSSGREERLSEFITHRSHLRRMLWTQLPAEDVEQVLNDVAMRYIRIDRPLESGQVLAYLRAMAKNAVVDHWRDAARRRREVLVGGQAELDPLRCEDPLNSLERSSEEIVADILMREELRRKITSLAPMMRKVIELVYLGGMSSAEAARVMRIPEPAVRKYRTRGLRRLRELYAEDPRSAVTTPEDET
ncbi:RNA polymerase sigma factor [Streptomyces griseoincarnatus]